jgi:hypothetical protein
LSKKQGADVLLVTSDREIRDWGEVLHVSSISSQDFHRLFVDVMKHEERQMGVLQQTMHKTKSHNKSDNMLDVLMEQGSRNLIPGQMKIEYECQIRVRDGKKASKVDKLVMKKIDKI